MRDLEAVSGLPASTIRHYLAAGLLPGPVKPTRNSAIYDARHVAALTAICRVRTLDADLSLAGLKRVLELVAEGVEPEVALALRRAVTRGTPDTQGSPRLGTREVIRQAPVRRKVLDGLIAQGIIVPLDAETGPSFDVTDLEIVRAVLAIESRAPGITAVVARIAGLLREASALEMGLRNDLVVGSTAQQAATASQQLQEWGNAWHAYLFARLRLKEIRRVGLGLSGAGHPAPETSRSRA